MISKVEANSILNELLAHEQQQLALRVAESTCFISRLDVAQVEIVERLVRQAQSNCERLCETIVGLGGAPWPRGGDINTGHLHFQVLHHVLPLLVSDYDKLVSAYRQASQRLSGFPAGSSVVGDILAGHEASLDSLRACCGAGTGG